jgi:hypothetical protein
MKTAEQGDVGGLGAVASHPEKVKMKKMKQASSKGAQRRRNHHRKKETKSQKRGMTKLKRTKADEDEEEEREQLDLHQSRIPRKRMQGVRQKSQKSMLTSKVSENRDCKVRISDDYI